jgi:putative acetyltransferase
MHIRRTKTCNQEIALMFLIRPEEPADVAAIRGLIADAFRDHPHSNQTEHLVVDALREAGALMISFVAIDKEMIGCVAFSPVTIDGAGCGWIGLGPVAVRADRRHRGVGEALILEGLEYAERELDAQGCVVLGDPGYYEKYGFETNTGLILDGVPPEYFQALPFGGRTTPSGKVAYHAAFSICA